MRSERTKVRRGRDWILGVPILTSTPSHQCLNLTTVKFSCPPIPFLLWEDLLLKMECQEYPGIKCIRGNDVCFAHFLWRIPHLRIDFSKHSVPLRPMTLILLVFLLPLWLLLLSLVCLPMYLTLEYWHSSPSNLKPG